MLVFVHFPLPVFPSYFILYPYLPTGVRRAIKGSVVRSTMHIHYSGGRLIRADRHVFTIGLPRFIRTRKGVNRDATAQVSGVDEFVERTWRLLLIDCEFVNQ